MDYISLVNKYEYDLTIFITTFNRDIYFEKCLESVLKQSVNDFYVVVLDNASTDNTTDVVNKFKDERVVYIKHKENIGGTRNLNFALKMCLTKYCVIFHDDDIMASEMIKTERLFMRTDKYNMVAVKAQTFEHDISERLSEKDVYKNTDIIINEYSGGDYIRSFFSAGNDIMCPSVMMNIASIRDNGLSFNNEVGPCTDMFLWAELERAGGIIGNIQCELMYHRQHNQQDSNKQAITMEIDFMRYISNIPYYRTIIYSMKKDISKMFSKFIRNMSLRYSKRIYTYTQFKQYCLLIPAACLGNGVYAQKFYLHRFVAVYFPHLYLWIYKKLLGLKSYAER